MPVPLVTAGQRLFRHRLVFCLNLACQMHRQIVDQTGERMSSGHVQVVTESNAVRGEPHLPPSIGEYHAGRVLPAAAYEPYIGRRGVEELERLAEAVAGRTWANVNSTFAGGGVAEILHSVLPLARGLGIAAHWYAIQSHDGFFQVTKKFHCMLQGLDLPISVEEIFGAYLDTIDKARRTMPPVEADLIVIHDPQPAALAMSGVLFGNVLWRCHIDTSAPNPVVWRFLLPYINHCSGAVFTIPEFVGPGLHIPLYQIFPCIDPLTEKNALRGRREVLDILAPLLQRDNVDPERPILAAVSRYDIHKNQTTILEAFKKLRQRWRFDPPPYLIFLGNTATDDPEGASMLADLQRQAGDDADVRFWANVEDNDRVVGALMQLARGFVHVSTREGFGLVVSEALWHGTPVIGSRVGGIVRQVVDGRTGYLVEPTDEDGVAARMARLLDQPDEAAALGARGRQHVLQNFLLPALVRRYLTLLRFYSGVDHTLPTFRLNDIAYAEIINQARPRHPALIINASGVRNSRTLLS